MTIIHISRLIINRDASTKIKGSFILFQFLKKKDNSHFAVDIGSHSTKIMDVTRSGSKVKVKQFSIKRTPPDCFGSGSILDEDKLAQFIANTIVELDMPKTELVCGISGKSFITKKINVPQMEANLIEEHLPFEAEQYLPYDVSEMNLNYEILKGFNEDESSNAILLIAVLKKSVQQYCSVFEKASLSCHILDSNAFAMANICEMNHDIDEKESYLLIDIGATNTNLVIISKKQVLFTRSLSIGGDYYNQEISKILGVSPEEAESLKLQAGKEDAASQDVTSVIRDVNQLLCEEIRAGYDFYVNSPYYQQTSRLFLTGGGSQVPHLTPILEEGLSLPSEPMQIFKNMHLSDDVKSQQMELEPLAATISGLALRTI